MLRNYAKLCQKEGVNSDRVRVAPPSSNADRDTCKSAAVDKKPSGAKPSPFAKAQQQAEAAALAKKQGKQSAADAAKTREQEIRQAANRRKSLTKLHTARTPKGQPMLSRISTVLLQKISAGKV